MATSATLKATDYTKVAAIVAGTESGLSTFPDASKRKLHAHYDEWSSATAYDDPSTISFMLLPKGARVLAFIVNWDAQGAAVTADFEIGGVAACAAEAVTDMTSAGQLVIPALATFSDTPLAADSILTMITADQALGQDDKICVTCLYLNED